MEIDDRIESTRNRVFTQELAFGKDNPISLKTKDTSVYRVTGMHQIEDIINTGYVRAKEKVKGSHKKELFWSRGGDKLFYWDKRPVLQASEDKVIEGQMGAIPLDDLTSIWYFSEEENKYVNIIEYIKELREKQIENKNGRSR